MTMMARHRKLVARLEAELQTSPRGYRAKLMALALLGYAVLIGLLVLAFGLSFGLLALLLLTSPILLLKLAKIIWIPLLFGWLLLCALWIRFTPPEGHRLGREEAPQLQAEVERLRQAVGAPRLDGIFIDDQLNAAAVNLPRFFGLFGQRYYLLLGLPLMQLLSTEQLRSVIAHEFGHFSGRHGRFGGWIYRVRTSWERLLEALDDGSWTGKIPGRFFRWYSPYFNAYSYALIRRNEYEADAVAAQLAGAEAAGQALVRTHLASEYLQKTFWPDIERRVCDMPEPPARIQQDMAQSLRQPHPDDEARLQRLATRLGDPDDTHPTLAQRLAALQAPLILVPPPAQTAAEAWLGPLLPELEANLSQSWRMAVAEYWQEQHGQLQQDKARLAELEARPPLDARARAEHALLTAHLYPERDVIALYRQALQDEPNNAMAHFHLGVRLLQDGQGEGVFHLREAIRHDGSCEIDALEWICTYHRERHEDAEWDQALQQLQQAHARREADQLARSTTNRRDAVQAHALPAAALEALVAELARTDWIKQAWLVQKNYARVLLCGSALSVADQTPLVQGQKPWQEVRCPGRAHRSARFVTHLRPEKPAGTQNPQAAGQRSLSAGMTAALPGGYGCWVILKAGARSRCPQSRQPRLQ